MEDDAIKFEDMTAEQIEHAKKCETLEERKAFIEAESIELTDQQLEGIAGGKRTPHDTDNCPKGGNHYWVETGNTRPGKVFGNVWPDKEKRCTRCGETIWAW